MVTSGKELQYLADLGRDLRRFVERDGVGHGGAHPQRAFVQLRHELGADARDEQQRTRQQNGRGERRPPGMGEAEIEALGVSRFDGFESGVAPLPHALAHEPGAQHRQQRQRDDQRADQREDHGVRHRLEQRPGRPGQDIDRQEAGHDHRDRVEQRAIHFRRRVADDFHDVERRSLARGDLAEDVLHHHHRAIHQDAEIHRADGEQVGRGVLQIEADEREQQRQRDGGGDDQARRENRRGRRSGPRRPATCRAAGCAPRPASSARSGRCGRRTERP